MIYRYISGRELGTKILSTLFFNNKNPDSFLAKKGVSSSSFSEARDKLSWEVFPYLLDKLKVQSEKWKGHVVRAIDGTQLTLPRTEETLRKFPLKNCNFGKVHYPKAILVAATEIYTGQITNTYLGNKHLSERQSLMEILPQFQKGDIALLDRGFDGKNLWYKFHEEGQYFVARFKNTGAGVLQGFNPKLRDQTIEVCHRETGITMSLRIIRGKRLRNGDQIFLITNLVEKKKYKRKELLRLYLNRQAVEESFKQIKKQLTGKLEYRAKKLNSVLQEIYAAVLAQAIIGSVKARIPKKTRQVISFIGVASVIEKDFYQLFYRSFKKKFCSFIEAISGHYHCRQEGRHYPRYSRQAPSKWILEKRKKVYRRKIKELNH